MVSVTHTITHESRTYGAFLTIWQQKKLSYQSLRWLFRNVNEQLLWFKEHVLSVTYVGSSRQKGRLTSYWTCSILVLTKSCRCDFRYKLCMPAKMAYKYTILNLGKKEKTTLIIIWAACVRLGVCVLKNNEGLFSFTRPICCFLNLFI